MPAWNPTVKRIFLEALEIADPDERARFLASSCDGDPSIRAQVDALLDAVEEAGTPAGQSGESSMATPASTVVYGPIEESAGTVVGPYKLLEAIGEGGFGIVYMADQQVPVRRRVAVKIIKPGMDSRQVLARFDVERQALAMMDHPNIARALDAGTTSSGRPYFVMELVRGVPITDYCDRNNLSVDERLEIFIQICQAVQHAHQKGIIHRDLKPSNVLVTVNDGIPIPKVIDFGVAKAIHHQLTDKTLFTHFAEMVGTPLYMSPEQAEMTSLDVDTRSDIYSLGVLLYELLTGTTPFDKQRLNQLSFDEVRRIIREEDPPKPSTRLSTLGQKRTDVAARRASDPIRLRQVVRGDLDWIVMKALAKDRTRRYDTASTFATDVRRYLEHLPIEAHPPSVFYRSRRFVRRHRVAFTTVSLVLAALLVGTVMSVAQAIRATTAERITTQALETETQALIAAKDAKRAESEERRIAQAKAAEAEANFRKARQAVDEYFTVVSESRLFDSPGFQPLRKQLLEGALRYYEEFVEQCKQDPRLQAELAATLLRVAQSDLQNLQPDESVRAVVKSLNIIDDLRQRKALNSDDVQRLVGFGRVGRFLHSWADLPDEPRAALRVLERAVSTWEQFLRDFPKLVGTESDLAYFERQIGAIEISTDQPEKASRTFHKACDIWEQLVRDYPNQPEYQAGLADSLEYLSIALKDSPRPFEREAAFLRGLTIREKLAADLPSIPDYRASLANSLLFLHTAMRSLGRLKDAERISRRSLEIIERLVTEFPNSPAYRSQMAEAQKRLGGLLVFTGRPKDGERAFRQALDLETHLAAEFPKGRSAGHFCYEVADTTGSLIGAVRTLGREQDVEPLCRQAMALADKVSAAAPNEWQSLGHSYRILADGFQSIGRIQDSEHCIRQALPMFEKLTAAHPNLLKHTDFLADTHRMLADTLVAENQLGEAEQSYRRGIAVHEAWCAKHAAAPWIDGWSRPLYERLAAFLVSRGKQPEAAELYQSLAARLLQRGGVKADEIVAIAQKAVDWAPKDSACLNTLGIAQYRAGNWQGAAKTLSDAARLSSVSNGAGLIVLAMADWKLGKQADARNTYEKALAGMQSNKSGNADLKPLITEAEKLFSQKASTK
jgi:serine/threonine protein kinase